MEVAEIAARAAGENFPVGSVLFPRALRPHVRALYCYARLVDELGDAYDGDRLAALDELEREVELTFEGEPDLAGAAQRAADRARVRPSPRAVSAPDRGEPHGPARLRVRDLGRRQGTTASIRPIRAGGSCSACSGGSTTPSSCAASDSVCTGLQLVNFLQDVPRDLELGRIYLPADDRRRFGDPALDRPSGELRELLRFEAERAAALLGAGDVLRAGIGGRLGRAVVLFARGGLAALEALESAGWDVFTQRPRPSRARLAREAAWTLVR